MKVLVTGSTGFIGQHIVPELLNRGVEVIATSTNEEKAKKSPWFDQVEYLPCNYHSQKLDYIEYFGYPDVLIHLAWSGLPNYNSVHHVEINLPANCLFLKNFVESGLRKWW